ncbi:MAG TPA: sulfatase [Candidatus Brocadiia bacterium]|nr:sulfatase [Candidatus Brocadiia bacterium]
MPGNIVSRRELLRYASGAVALSGFPNLTSMIAAAQTAGERPNILFIFADDHACRAIGAYGSKVNKTPNIDRIASEGALFENSFCTNSICAPSRAVVLTGRYSHLNGVMTNAEAFDGSQPTYPQILRAAGYQTATIGKWHLKSDPTGFDFWNVLPGQGEYYNPDFMTPKGKVRREGYATDIITDLSLEWMKSRDPGKPFLLHCWHKAPHRSWMPGPTHLTTYDDAEIPEPSTLFDDYADRASPARNHEMGIARHMNLPVDLKVTPPLTGNPLSGPLAIEQYRRMNERQRKLWDAAYVPKNEAFRKENPQGDDLVRWKYRRYMQDYLGCIASVDDGVGRLLAYLDESGLAKNTIVIYCSDQGFYLGEHGWFDKRWIYEESLRMPLMIRWPEVIKAGTRVKEMVQNLDYAPTFCEVAGVKPSDGFQGVSMKSLMAGEHPADWRKSIYYHYCERGVHNVAPHYGLRTERFTMAHFYMTDEWELFDLEKDPLQMKSVYADPAYAGTVKELKDELTRLREKYGDTKGA